MVRSNLISTLISTLMNFHDFFIVMSVYALSWFHRKWFVKHERKWFVKTSSYMLCQDFFIVMSVNVLSWFLHRTCFVETKRICFVETSSFMFCQGFIVNDLSKLLHRNERICFVKHERKCFVMISSSYMFCHDFFIVMSVYALSNMSVNDPKIMFRVDG